MILVTGASKGIGWGICKALLGEGCKVLGTYHSANVEKLPQAENLIWKQLNLENSDTVYPFIEALTKEGISIDHLVNNAGISQKKDILDISKDDWQNIFEVNFFGPVKLLMELTKIGDLKRAVNLISVSAFTGGVQQPHYAASKAALLNYTKSFANFSSKHNVIVNSIAPGLIKTEMLDSLIENETYDKLSQNIPINRIGEPSDIASVVTYLLLTDPGYLNGQTITVNGGNHV